MILQSDSGYCMPFEEQQGKDVELSLGYGEQTDPATGEKFFHHGIDFNVRCYMLSALASGIVSGVGNDSGHGICQTIRYGEYEVTYGNLSNVFAQFGQPDSSVSRNRIISIHTPATAYFHLIDHKLFRPKLLVRDSIGSRNSRKHPPTITLSET